VIQVIEGGAAARAARQFVIGDATAAGIHASQLYGWRRQLRAQPPMSLAPVRIAPEGPAGLIGPGTIEIEFASGARIRIAGAADPAMLTAAVAALSCGRRRSAAGAAS
jgi:transposase